MFSILLYTFAGVFLLWMVLLSLGVRRIWLNVMLFTLEATLAYTIVGNLVPQIESRPQAALQLSPDATPEQLVKAGEQLFYGKGTCALCHSIDPSEAARCPQLGSGTLGPAIGARAEERVKEPGYHGKAKDGTEYLIESVTHPQDYLVQGFPPIMPVINKPPIGLNNDEIAAVLAFLQSIQGGKVTVTPKMVAAFTGTEGPAQPGTAVAQPVVATATDRPPQQLIAELVCIGCHKFDEPGPSSRSQSLGYRGAAGRGVHSAIHSRPECGDRRRFPSGIDATGSWAENDRSRVRAPGTMAKRTTKDPRSSSLPTHSNHTRQEHDFGGMTLS